MAYRNASGQITIDEAAAMADVAKELQAIIILTNTKESLKQLANEASSYRGETMVAIVDQANEMIKKIDHLIANLDEAQAYTKKVVAHYKLIDQQCAAAINGK